MEPFLRGGFVFMLLPGCSDRCSQFFDLALDLNREGPRREDYRYCSSERSFLFMAGFVLVALLPEAG